MVLGLMLAWPMALQLRAEVAPPAVQPIVISYPQPETRDKHEIWRANDGLFYVEATVNGQTVRFLVDTGASMIVLTAEDARRAGVAPGGGAGYVASTATGASTMGAVTIDHIEVAGRREHAVRAAVAQPGLSVSLLGANWLQILDTVTIEGDRMTLR